MMPDRLQLTRAAVGLAAALIGLALSGAGPASARASADHGGGQRSFGVQPAGPKKPDPRPNFTYRNVKPGQRLFDHVAFVNISDKPVTLTVYPADAYTTTTGGFDLLPQARRSRDLGSWVTMRRTRATVPARSALVTPIEIRVPAGAEPGDHAGGIVASLKTLAKDSRGNTVTIDQRVATRMYIRVAGKLTPRITLEHTQAVYHPGGNPFGRGAADVTYTIRNTGNVRLVGARAIRVSDVFGSSRTAPGGNGLSELLPGGSFTVHTRVDKVLPSMFLTAHVTIDPQSVTGNVDPALQQARASTHFWAPYWPLLALLLLALLEGLRRWWVRRRRLPAGPAFAEGDPAGPQPVPSLTLSRNVIRAALVLGAVAGSFLLAGGTAQAAGGLTFVPAKGQDISPMYAVTPAGCPAGATNLVGRLYGPGFGSGGVVVIPNSDAALKHDAGFGVPLQDTLSSFAADAGVKLNGKYTIKIQCVNELATHTFAEFTGTVTFAGPKHFTAPAPKTPPAEGVPVGFLAQVFPEFKPGAGPSAPAAASPAAPGPAGSAPASAASPAGARPAASTISDVTPFLVVLLGVVALGAVGFVATRGRPRPSGAAAADRAPAVEWPDETDHPAEVLTPDRTEPGRPS